MNDHPNGRAHLECLKCGGVFEVLLTSDTAEDEKRMDVLRLQFRGHFNIYSAFA